MKMSPMYLPWHQYLYGIFFALAGLNHFRVPRMYKKIIPPFFKNKAFWNALSGISEIVFGFGLLFPTTSVYAAWGLVLLLTAIFPANVYMYKHDEAAMGLSKTIRLGRLPLQFLLIAWALVYTGIF